MRTRTAIPSTNTTLLVSKGHSLLKPVILLLGRPAFQREWSGLARGSTTLRSFATTTMDGSQDTSLSTAGTRRLGTQFANTGIKDRIQPLCHAQWRTCTNGNA